MPLYAQQPSPTYDPTQVTVPTTAPMALFGELSYQQNCAPCHGAEGMGNGPTAAELPGPPTAFADPDAIWALSPSELFHTTKFGRLENLMPPWRNQLSDAEIWQTVAYAWSLHTTESEYATGSDLYSANCAACHGEAGGGDGPDAAVDLIDFSNLDYAVNNSQATWLAGWQNAHPEIGGDWSNDDQRAVLEYIRTFSYVPPWGTAYHAGTGIIQGQVTQGTPDGEDAGGLLMSLEVYAGFTPVATFTTTVDATGSYTFTDVATDPNMNYLASVRSADIRYSSAILNFAEGTAAINGDIAIYATTTDPAAIRFNSVHWIIDPRPGAVTVIEVYGVGNDGNRTFVGTAVDGLAQAGTVAMSVPTAAQDLSFENGILGERFQLVGNTAYDTAPVLPGQGSRQIIMRYLLPVADRTVDVTRDFSYAVDEMSLLVAELPDVEADIPGFALSSRETFQGQTYQLWRAEGAIPETLTIHLTGLLAANDVDPRMTQGGVADGSAIGSDAVASAIAAQLLPSWVVWSVAGLVLFGLIGSFGWAIQRGKLSSGTGGAGRNEQRTALLQRIARLDDQHAIGELSDDQWLQQRARLKAQLLTLTQSATK